MKAEEYIAGVIVRDTKTGEEETMTLSKHHIPANENRAQIFMLDGRKVEFVALFIERVLEEQPEEK